MKKIAICGSMSASKEMLSIAQALSSFGFEVALPDGIEAFASGERSPETAVEASENKRHGDLIRGYYEEIKSDDAVLIVNPPKRGVEGYIGGNTFLEFAFGHVLGKPVYLLNDFDRNSSYAAEMAAMQPIILHGDLSKITL